MKIKNQIDKTITLKIEHPFEKFEIDIEPDQTSFIPFDYLSFLCKVFVDGK